MMNSTITVNAFRFVILVLLQGLVLQNIGNDWATFPYFNIFLYPIFIFLLPLRTPKPLVIFLAFILGLIVDLFYATPGVHTSASVFTAFVRPVVLNYFEPRAGYNANHSPTKKRLGLNWYIKYSLTLELIHLFFYFSVEAFSPVFIVNILIKTGVALIASMIFIIIHQILFDPAE
jgi:hypothetical protein